jgi:hypothetical protein
MSMQTTCTSHSSRPSTRVLATITRAVVSRAVVLRAVVSRAAVSVFALGLAAACNEYPLHDLGYTSGDDSASSDAPDAPLPPVAEFAREFAGSWVGTAEDPLALRSNADVAPPPYVFPSGSPRIQMELSLTDDASYLYGTITFGNTTPPPLATDAKVAYAIEPSLPLDYLGEDVTLRPPVDGFAYQLGSTANVRDVAATGIDQTNFFEDGRVADGKLELDFYPTEAFSSWCALQTLESCPPNVGYSFDDQGNCIYGGVPMDCGKAAQCSGDVCACEEGYPCTASYDRSSKLTLRFSEGGLVGLFNGVFRNERGFQQPLGTVHFRRVEASTEVNQ